MNLPSTEVKPSITNRHPRKRSGFRFLLLAASIAVSLTIAEIIVRLVFPSAGLRVRIARYLESERGKFCRYSPTLGWEGIPNAAQSFQYVDARCFVRQNQWGFRGTEFSKGIPLRKRIVVLGDSFVWGFGVNNDEIFSEVMLHRASTPIEVVNLGVPGYGNDQELLLWQAQGREWNPAEVLLVVDPWTDLFDGLHTLVYEAYQKPAFLLDTTGQAHLINVPVPKSPPRPTRLPTEDRATGLTAFLIEHSDLACVAISALSRYGPIRECFEKRGLILSRRAGYDCERTLYSRKLSGPDDEAEAAWRLMTNLIGLLSADVKRAGAGLTLVAVPSPVQVYPELWNQFVQKQNQETGGTPKSFGALDRTLPNERLREIAQRLQIKFIDLLPDFQAAGRTNDSLYFPDNCHWTKAGNQLTAEVILREMGMKH